MSGSGRMPCVPCVLPRPGTLCSMLVCVGAAVVCQCLCVCRRAVCSLCLLSAIGRVHTVGKVRAGTGSPKMAF